MVIFLQENRPRGDSPTVRGKPYTKRSILPNAAARPDLSCAKIPHSGVDFPLKLRIPALGSTAPIARTALSRPIYPLRHYRGLYCPRAFGARR